MKRLLRYAVVGLVTNLLGFIGYLIITWLGAEPKIAMTFLYLVGASASFFANRRWTFSHRGSVATGGVRFAVAHVLGYLLNLSILSLFVDRLGYPHQYVQAVAILVVAGFLFVLFRWFVFPQARKGPEAA